MENVDLCYTPAVELARAIRERRLSPVELVEAVLARIEWVNPRINAYCTVAAASARDAARDAERRVMRDELLGPLHGVPVSFKDLTPTAGIRTTFGSPIFEHHVPKEDAALVQRVKAAGAIVLGKTNTPEFGCKGVTENPVFGATRNPWNLAMTPGGSSGGAAASVAAGLGPLAEGSDLGGSIRIPAAACGVVGLKPSPGRVPQYPAVNGWSTLWALGPLSRTVRDAALFFGVMSGPDERDPTTIPDTGEDFIAACDKPLQATSRHPLRVAWSPDLGYATVDRQVAAITGDAVRVFADLGCELEEDNPGFDNPEELYIGITAPLRAAEVGHHLANWADQMDPILVARVSAAADLSSIQYEQLFQRRTELYQRVRHFLERYDLLLTPTIALSPFPIDAPYPPAEVDGRPLGSVMGAFPFTFPFNLTGHPAISLPAGWTDDGLPVGLQIVGRRYDEATVLRAAAAFEQARPWATRRPPLMVESC